MRPSHLLSLPVDPQTQLCAWVAPNPGAATRVVVTHGNGLASGGYRVFWEALCADHEVVCLDLRGHGASEAGPADAHDWDHFNHDMDAVADALERELGPRRTVGAMHSLGAVASLLQMQRGQSRWDALALFDLSCAPPRSHPLAAVHAQEMALRARRARNRRSRFEDPAQVAAQFARADRVGPWQGDAPMDMARAVLRREPSESGEWVLSCQPEREASIYLGNTDMGLWDVLARPGMPVLLVGGDPTMAHADAPSRCCQAAHEATGVAYTHLPGSGHFLQLEQPERCRRVLNEFIEASQSLSLAAAPHRAAAH